LEIDILPIERCLCDFALNPSESEWKGKLDELPLASASGKDQQQTSGFSRISDFKLSLWL
jgi:hypothetical protein